MESPKLIKYVFIHEPSEVIITVHAQAQPQARTQIKQLVDGSPFTIPDGKWECIGVNVPDEEW